VPTCGRRRLRRSTTTSHSQTSSRDGAGAGPRHCSLGCTGVSGLSRLQVRRHRLPRARPRRVQRSFRSRSACPLRLRRQGARTATSDGGATGSNGATPTPNRASVGSNGCPSTPTATSVLEGPDQCEGTSTRVHGATERLPSDADGDGVCDGSTSARARPRAPRWMPRLPDEPMATVCSTAHRHSAPARPRLHGGRKGGPGDADKEEAEERGHQDQGHETTRGGVAPGVVAGPGVRGGARGPRPAGAEGSGVLWVGVDDGWGGSGGWGGLCE